jgi:hypothetical protein
VANDCRHRSNTLAVRPRPTAGESLPGYIMRVAHANGFASVRQLYGSLREREHGAFDELCTRLRLDRDERAMLFGALPSHWRQVGLPLSLAVTDFNHTCRRWCPLCLKDGKFLQGHWSLKLSCICLQHGVWLRDTCPRCGAICGWSGVLHTRCSCLADLADGMAEMAESPSLLVSQQICGTSPAARDMTVWSPLHPAAMHRLVRYLGNFATSARPAHPGQIENAHRMSIARLLVVGTAHLLQEWPVNLHKLMATLQSTAPQSLSVRRTFAPMYRVLYDDLSDSCYQFLRDAFEDYLHQRWWGLVCRRNRRMKEVTQTSHPRVTLPQAAKEVNASISVVRHLVQASLISEVSTPLPSGRRSRTLHVSELPLLKDAVAGAVSLAQAARILALPKRRLRDLIAAKALSPLICRRRNPAAAAWLIPKSEIDRLHVIPSHVPMTSPHSEDVRTVLKYWRLREHEAVAFIQAVMGGELKAHTHLDAGMSVPIGLASLPAQEVKQWLAAYRRAPENDLSVDQAAQALGIKQQVAYALVHAGLLIASRREGALGRRVLTCDLHSFKATYVSLADLARDTRRSPRALLAEIAVAPVCGPSVDGCRQYFFRRAELQPSRPTPRDLSTAPSGHTKVQRREP